MTSSPTFIARFADDHETRMTVYHDPEHKTLDLKRGVTLARYAYTSRTRKKPGASAARTAPTIPCSPSTPPTRSRGPCREPLDRSHVLRQRVRGRFTSRSHC